MSKPPSTHAEYMAQVEAGKALLAAASPGQRALVDEVRTYAQAHYEQGGWDFVIECWEDHDIFAYLVEADFNLDKALSEIADAIGIVDERRTEIQNA